MEETKGIAQGAIKTCGTSKQRNDQQLFAKQNRRQIKYIQTESMATIRNEGGGRE